MTDPLLARLAAENAIRRLVSSYCDAVARRDADAARELFTPDAYVRIAHLPERVGRDAIVEGLRESVLNFSFLQQKCDVGLIDIDGDTARARLWVFEANRRHGVESLNLIFGNYEDEYRLVEAGWRFHRRRFTLQCRAVLPAEIQQLPDFVPGFTFAP